MSITIKKTKLNGVLKITHEGFEDHRGIYRELYSEKEYQEAGIDIRFIEDDISASRKHVLRGIHGDNNTWKLVSCLHGSFYLVVVNCDKESDAFGSWERFTLSEQNNVQILIPPKHGNGHVVMSEKAIFHYKQSAYYNPEGQFTYTWNDPALNVWWPIKNPILSERDESGHFVD